MNGEEVNPSDYLDLLNGNLVYLCEKPTNNTTDIVDCHGIGTFSSKLTTLISLANFVVFQA